MGELKQLRRKRDGDIYTPDLAPFVREFGPDHDLAIKLWDTGYDAARELAIQLAEPARITSSFLEDWLTGLNEWGLCDGFVARLVRPTKFAVPKARAWAKREPEYEKRAAFALMAQMAWQQNEHGDDVFLGFLPIIERHAEDDRFYVKKAVNWALRDIGKRNPKLARKSLAVAKRLQSSDSKAARWVGTHRIREVTDAHS